MSDQNPFAPANCTAPPGYLPQSQSTRSRGSTICSEGSTFLSSGCQPRRSRTTPPYGAGLLRAQSLLPSAASGAPSRCRRSCWIRLRRAGRYTEPRNRLCRTRSEMRPDARSTPGPWFRRNGSLEGVVNLCENPIRERVAWDGRDHLQGDRRSAGASDRGDHEGPGRWSGALL